MFGKKFFSTVALGGSAVSLVGNSGQVLAQNDVTRLQEFVDFLEVSKSEFQRLCEKAEIALHMAEQAARGENYVGEDIYFSASKVGHTKDPYLIPHPLLSVNEKIFAVLEPYFFENEFHFKNKEKTRAFDWESVSFEQLRYYLRELKDNPSLLESIRFKK